MIATEPRRLRRALTTAALLLAFPLTGCTFHDTDFVYTPAQGVNDRDGAVDVLNALIVSGEEGEGRFIVGLANNDLEQGDELTGVTGSGEDSGVQVQVDSGETEIPAGGFLQLADPESAVVTVTGEDVVPGTFIRLTMEFANAEPVEVHVPVVEPGEDFADVTSSSPSATPTDDQAPGGESESPAPAETESPVEE